MSRHRRSSSHPSVFIGRNAMHKALAMREYDEYDRSIAISLALLFNERSHPFGRGLVLELFDGKLARKNQNRVTGQPADASHSVACIAVSQFPPNNAKTLWNAAPPNRRLDLLTCVLSQALIDQDSGWIRAAREEIERLRVRDLRNATNRRVGDLCFEVVDTLRAHYGTGLPRGAIGSPAWQKCFVWMIERLIEAAYDGVVTQGKQRRTIPEHIMLVPAEWLAQSLDHLPRSQVFTLDRACDLALVDTAVFPTLGKISANIRREHLEFALSAEEQEAGWRREGKIFPEDYDDHPVM